MVTIIHFAYHTARRMKCAQVTPLLYMWERLIGTHTKAWCVDDSRAQTHLPMATTIKPLQPSLLVCCSEVCATHVALNAWLCVQPAAGRRRPSPSLLLHIIAAASTVGHGLSLSATCAPHRYIRMPSRLPVSLLIWLFAMAFPFYGSINSLMAAISVPFTAFAIPSLTFLIIYRRHDLRLNAVLPPLRWLRVRSGCTHCMKHYVIKNTRSLLVDNGCKTVTRKCTAS